MKKNLRKNTQLSLTNPKNAGRKAIHDKGIRHTERENIAPNTALHLTIKIQKEKAALKNKAVLKVLHHAIKKARVLGLKVLHYTLEYDHIHLMVEASDKITLGKGMQSFGITLSKGINKIKTTKGSVFKTRYHFRKLKTPKEIKNVINYIFGNGIKHKSDMAVLNPYNSVVAVSSFRNLYPGFERTLEASIKGSFHLKELKANLKTLLSPPSNSYLKYTLG